MKINPKYKVRQVANENVILVQGRNAGDMTTVIALNETSLYLWNSLCNRDFDRNDVISLLTDRFEVDEQTVSADADNWIATLQKHNIVA